MIKLDAFLFTRHGTVPDKIETVSEGAISNTNNSAAAFAQARNDQVQGDGAQVRHRTNSTKPHG